MALIIPGPSAEEELESQMPLTSTAPPGSTLPDLAAIRASKGIRLEDISRATKISTRYLQAIERGDFDLLPGGVFNLSYIRQYARAIDYDEWELLACYEASVPPELPETERPELPQGWLARVAMPLFRRLAIAKKS